MHGLPSIAGIAEQNLFKPAAVEPLPRLPVEQQLPRQLVSGFRRLQPLTYRWIEPPVVVLEQVLPKIAGTFGWNDAPPGKQRRITGAIPLLFSPQAFAIVREAETVTGQQIATTDKRH